jgi:hypothetical protein
MVLSLPLMTKVGPGVRALLSRDRLPMETILLNTCGIPRLSGMVCIALPSQQDPVLLMLIGLPPKDLLEDIWQAVMRTGKDPEAFFRKNLSVTQELL